ncbi:MAG: hypothetical protein U9Q33_12590 [Campylobacterota bacterium]|nr:hypothetical protein [Campylobacterota bacterium]
MNQETQENIFKVIHTTQGKSKDKTTKVLIETSRKDLLYRTEVYKEGHLIDAKEVSCQDLASAEDKEFVFRERYLAAHNKFEDLYLAQRVFVKVLSDEGEYVDDEEAQCSVATSVYENIVRHEVFLGAAEIDKIEETIDKDISANPKSFKAKYTQMHKEVVEKYIIIPKFPTNTFLNPILKKFPFYKTKPMYSLYMFLATVVFVLWVLSLVVCGKALKKIVVKVAGKEAGLVVKDLQKSMCVKGGEDDKLNPEQLLDENDVVDLYGTKYVILPEKVSFKNTKEIKAVYFKNNLKSDLIVQLRERLITDFNNPLVTPDMIVNILSPKIIHIKGNDIGYVEFKIEDEFLKEGSILGKQFKGNLVFDIINVREKKSEPIAIEFDFRSDEEPKTEIEEE